MWKAGTVLLAAAGGGRPSSRVRFSQLEGMQHRPARKGEERSASVQRRPLHAAHLRAHIANIPPASAFSPWGRGMQRLLARKGAGRERAPQFQRNCG